MKQKDNHSITWGESACLLGLLAGLFWLLIGGDLRQVQPAKPAPPIVTCKTTKKDGHVKTTKRRVIMTLPAKEIVSGAGTVAVNGDYLLASGTDANGNPYFQFGSGEFCYYSPGAARWAVGTALNDWTSGRPTATVQYYQDSSVTSLSAGPASPASTWGTNSATTPAPAVTAGQASIARIATNSLLSETPQRDPQARARTAAVALLTTAALGTVTHGPRTLTPVVVVNGLFAQSAQRGPQAMAPRTASNGLLSEASPSRGSVLPTTTATEPPLLTSAGNRGPASFALRTAGNNLILTEAGRGGRVAPAGSTPVPIVLLQRPLFTEAAARSPVTFASRTAVNALFAQSVLTGPRGRVRTAVNALLSQSARCLGIRPAPTPGMVDPRDPFQVLITELQYLAAQKVGSPVAFANKVLALLDKLAASYRTNDLNLSANTLAGLPVIIRGGDGVSDLTYGFGQDGPILDLLPAADALIAAFVPSKILDGLYRPIFTKIDGVLISQGYASLNVFLTSLNASSPGSYLVHPNTALLYYLYKNQQGALLLSPGNVFAPQTLFGTAAVGAGGAATFTDLNFIPAANITSPTPGLSTQGYTGAKGISLLVTTAVNGTLAVTVTDQAGVTWTAALDNKAAGQMVLMTPGTAGARVLDVVSVTSNGTATAGAFQANSVLERVVS